MLLTAVSSFRNSANRHAALKRQFNAHTNKYVHQRIGKRAWYIQLLLTTLGTYQRYAKDILRKALHGSKIHSERLHTFPTKETYAPPGHDQL